MAKILNSLDVANEIAGGLTSYSYVKHLGKGPN